MKSRPYIKSVMRSRRAPPSWMWYWCALPAIVIGFCGLAASAFSAEEICGACGLSVSVTGEFSHEEENAPDLIEGVGDHPEAFRECISGDRFAVTVHKLPEGRYTVVIGAVETTHGTPGERRFSVVCGDESLAENVDIVAEADGPGKVCHITGEVEHSDDTLRGPLKVEFDGIKGRAKFNDYAAKHNGDSEWWTGLTFWTPNINLFRDPRWGRGQETYGEDPYLTGEMAVEFIRGIQGDDPNYMLAMACAKHYAVHSGPERDRHRFNAEPSERDLYEMYLPQFERAVRDGEVAGVMSAYNAVDGIPCSASSFLLTDLLRTAWGFTGYVVSDCGGIQDIWSARAHHFVDTPEEAAALAVKAGCNLCCGGDYNALVRAVQKGLVTEEDIDQSLYYTLWTRFRLGLFDPPDQVPYSKYTIADNDTPAHRQVALNVARQSLVLLKNDGILPLDRARYKRIAVIGPNGASKSMLEGNYHGSASQPVSILDGIRQVAGPDTDVTFALGSPVTTRPGQAAWSRQDNTTDRPIPDLRAEALEHAEQVDLIVYVGGITPAQEGEGFDRDAIELPDVQQALVRALQETGAPMVMVNCSGSAMALPWEDEHLPAILQAWYPGEEGGRAVAEVLFGEVNPSGRLPLTFYRATDAGPVRVCPGAGEKRRIAVCHGDDSRLASALLGHGRHAVRGGARRL